MANADFKSIHPAKWSLLLLVLATTACTSTVPTSRMPERKMNLTAGPDRVFTSPVDEVVSELSGAVATGSNGRVGNQLVFWEYRLRDNRRANLFACAEGDVVDCETRIRMVCPGGGEELVRQEAPGQVRHMDCQFYGVANVGELFPNCSDRELTEPLVVGLVQCR
jgi:hypothetical protein